MFLLATGVSLLFLAPHFRLVINPWIQSSEVCPTKANAESIASALFHGIGDKKELPRPRCPGRMA